MFKDSTIKMMRNPFVLLENTFQTIKRKRTYNVKVIKVEDIQALYGARSCILSTSYQSV